MRRLEFPPVQTRRVQMADFLGPDKPMKPVRKRGPRKASKSTAGMEEAIVAAEIFCETGAWEPGHDARQLVGLYIVLHTSVYGVAPEELKTAWVPAVAAATRLLDELGKAGVVTFLQYTWKAERAAEKRSEGTGQVRRRIGWYLQFVHRALVVDFKRAILRTGGKRK